MSKKLIGSFLPILGRLATPAAMVVFLAYEISTSQETTGGWQTAVVFGAIATAVGIEIVGILSGHALEGFWRSGDKLRTGIAFLLLVIYTVAGVYILQKNESLVVIPIIAAVLYIVSALVDGMEASQEQQDSIDAQRAALDLQQEAKDKEHQRQMEARDKEQAAEDKAHQRQLDLIAQEAKMAVSLAKIQAESAASFQQDTGDYSSKIPSDWRKVSHSQRHYLAHLSREERRKVMPKLSSRAQHDWHKRLDDIATQNGEYKP